MLTKDQKIAFAEFLLSEKERHEEDIAMINKKLQLMAAQGIYPQKVAPWVSDDLLCPDEDEQWIRPSVTDVPEPVEVAIDMRANASPFGSYWRYQLDSVLDNATGEDIDGFA